MGKNTNYKLSKGTLGYNTLNPSIYLSRGINNIMAFSCVKI